MRQSMKFACIRGTIRFALIFFAVFSLFPAAGFAETGKVKVYFFSSETNINNFKSLKMEFDAWLSRFGPYEFQPFSEKDLFEKQINGDDGCLLFLSSWHYNNIFREFSLTPFLVGVRKGMHWQKRILVTTDPEGDGIKGPVASASSEPNTRSILKRMFPGEASVDKVRILTVPKNIDALMSVGFQMSKSALVTEKALDDLKMLDTALAERLKIIAEGKETLLLILAGPKNVAEKVVERIKAMPDDPDGANIMKMLDLDSWKPVDSTDRKRLEEE